MRYRRCGLNAVHGDPGIGDRNLVQRVEHRSRARSLRFPSSSSPSTSPATGLLITLVGYGCCVCHCSSMSLCGSLCSELFTPFTPLLVLLPNDAHSVGHRQPSSSFSQLHTHTISCISCRILCASPVSNRDDDRMLVVLLNKLDLLDSQQLTARDPPGHGPQPTSGVKRSSSSKVSQIALSK